VLVIDDGELSNSIVFAFNGAGLARPRPGIVRRPKNLDATAVNQLQAAFALIVSALKDQGSTPSSVRPAERPPSPIQCRGDKS
jgi:hypothetical protein